MLKLLRVVFFSISLYLISSVAPSFAETQTCYGKFVNPLTDICWSCLFPISIGPVEMINAGNPDTKNPPNPLCTCPGLRTSSPRSGITFGFWEPIRMVDVSLHPYCFVNLGGLSLSLGSSLKTGAINTSSKEPGNHHSLYQVHWYQYPLLYWMNILTDLNCVEHGSFDVTYITELDPAWEDDELSFILNPEAVLFSKKATQLACAATARKVNSGQLPLDNLFWCAGSQGSIYPLSGTVQNHVSHVQATTLLTERITYKLQREGLLLATATDSLSPSKLCHPYLQPIMHASQYRYQMVNPTPANCYPYGKSTAIWSAGKQFPVNGEDFGYVVWRKRNCCAL